MYTIEKGVPITKHFKYPFDIMEVGDSFFIPAEENIRKIGNTVRFQVNLRQRRYEGTKYSTRTIKGEGIRIWRTK